MRPYWCLWVLTCPSGSLWVLLVIMRPYGSLWVLMGPYRFFYILRDFNGS